MLCASAAYIKGEVARSGGMVNIIHAADIKGEVARSGDMVNIIHGLSTVTYINDGITCMQ